MAIRQSKPALSQVVILSKGLTPLTEGIRWRVGLIAVNPRMAATLHMEVTLWPASRHTNRTGVVLRMEATLLMEAIHAAQVRVPARAHLRQLWKSFARLVAVDPGVALNPSGRL